MYVAVAALAAYFLVQPVLFAYVVTHVQRAVVPEDQLGVAHQDAAGFNRRVEPLMRVHGDGIRRGKASQISGCIR